MRYLRGPVAALLAFIFGVAVSPIRFEKEGMGYGRMFNSLDGFVVTTYRSSYFVTISFAHSGHPSVEKANDLFDEHLAEAVEVIEITAKLDEHGKTVGRRALAMFLDPTTDRHFACVFWTQGTLFHAIGSTSPVHVLEFEKQNVR
jgi:hypothetical protein